MSAGGGKIPSKQTTARKCPPKFNMRGSDTSDFAFCKGLYVDSMKPLLCALDAWDEKKANAAFKSYFKTDEIRIILVLGQMAGWMQVSETANAICLDQIHLLEEYRTCGIGSQLINETKSVATAKKKPILLSIIRGNPAIRLYKRLGFLPESEDDTKFHMRWKA